jgi:hypothetical protein
LRDGHHQQIGGERERRAVKVSARHDLVGVREHHRVVGRGVHLDLDNVADPTERFARRAVYLRRAPHGVGILHAPAVDVRRVDAAVREQP